MSSKCNLCPRKCNVDRNNSLGYCKSTTEIKLALASLHQWEEPCISGGNGSGTIFFSGCVLDCCFCQNFSVSSQGFGKEVSLQRLADIMLELQDKNAHNINLISPTHFADKIVRALDIAKPKLKIPVVYNTGGYENTETIDKLNGYIDVYLPDFKYYDNSLAIKYSNAPSYFEHTSKAITHMIKQVGKPVFDENNMLKKGVLIRHMVMPNCHKDSIAIMQWLAANLENDSFLVSVMSQYTPCFNSTIHPEINRKIFSYEYHKVVDMVEKLCLNGFMQEKSSATFEYTPNFDLSGI